VHYLLDAVAVDYFDYDYVDDYRYRRVEKLASETKFPTHRRSELAVGFFF